MSALTLSACAHPVEETLSRARSAADLPMPFDLVYEERSAALGGQRIELDRAGNLVRQLWRPGFAPAMDAPEVRLGTESSADRDGADQVVRARVPVGPLRELAQLLVALEAWEQEVDEDAVARVEDNRSRLTIHVDGGQSTIWEYSQDRVRLQRVKLALEALVTERSADEVVEAADQG